MSWTDPPVFRLHEDRVLFREAVDFTAAETAFARQLIEKDYFCSVLLQYLAAEAADLIFRGGTCLAKVHSGFYRLSEDLDFSIPVAPGTSRGDRRSMASSFKKAVEKFGRTTTGMHVAEPVRGANKSSQYTATIEYESVLAEGVDRVKIEVGLREPCLLESQELPVRTLLLHPATGEGMIPEFSVMVMPLAEVFAEKYRAALTRHEIAIRDYYDIVMAVDRGLFDPTDRVFIEMVRQKISVPGNDPVNISDRRMGTLADQVETDLKPVLRPVDLEAFGLDRAIRLVRRIAELLDG